MLKKPKHIMKAEPYPGSQFENRRGFCRGRGRSSIFWSYGLHCRGRGCCRGICRGRGRKIILLPLHRKSSYLSQKKPSEKESRI